MKNIKKLLSLLLCGIMLFGMFPASLFAADGDTGDGSGTISETILDSVVFPLLGRAQFTNLQPPSTQA